MGTKETNNGHERNVVEHVGLLFGKVGYRVMTLRSLCFACFTVVFVDIPREREK
jgi:hypothetical protein